MERNRARDGCAKQLGLSREEVESKAVDPSLGCDAHDKELQRDSMAPMPHILNGACPDSEATLLALVLVYARPLPISFQPGTLLAGKVELCLLSCRGQEAS